MPSVSALLDAATEQLAASLGLDTRDARLDTRVLAAHAWAVAHTWLIAHDRDPVDAAAHIRFQTLIERRAAGEPVAYLTGVREFYGRPFYVTPDVLIPRPDTELLVERVLACLPPDQPADVLDLGTGSGCIAITLALERPLARVVAVDQSAAALEVARHNARELGATVEFLVSNWFSALAGRQFDLIASNPPYLPAADAHLQRGDVRFEPRAALAAGPDGLADLTALCAAAPTHLKPGGHLLLEHGYDQAPATASILATHGFSALAAWRDLAGHLRVSGGKLSK